MMSWNMLWFLGYPVCEAKILGFRSRDATPSGRITISTESFRIFNFVKIYTGWGEGDGEELRNILFTYLYVFIWWWNEICVFCGDSYTASLVLKLDKLYHNGHNYIRREFLTIRSLLTPVQRVLAYDNDCGELRYPVGFSGIVTRWCQRQREKLFGRSTSH